MDREMLGRLSLLSRIVSDYGEKFRQLGKTAIQKTFYFLQERGAIEEELYSFKLYHYGPFSKELDWDTDMSESLKIINLIPEEFGYKCEPGQEVKRIEPYFNPQMIDFGKAKEVIDKISSKSAKESGLLATAHYVATRNETMDEAEKFKSVKKLKPLFSKEDIFKAFDTLKEWKWI